MSKRKIYILTGAIQTGKTTSLATWCANRNDVFGILTPVINGSRFFMDAHLRNQFNMDAIDGEQECFSIGRFKFSKAAFEKAIHIINGSIGKGWLVIDEIGPLELGKQGFYQAIKNVLKNHSQHLLFVIREGLVEKVTDFFDLREYEVVSKEKLYQL